VKLHILLALTSHGLGHLTRSLAIGSALRALEPSLELTVATTAPPERVALDLPGPFRHRPVDYEPGTLQRSCFELDVEGTRAAYRRVLAERASHLRAEKEFLRASGCHALVSDVPALPVRAAPELGLPAIGVSNFTWDWILAPLLEGSDASPACRLLADDYALGIRQLRLPFGPDTSPFQASEPAPLVGRCASLDSAEVRRRLGLPARESAPLVVVCPGGWDPDGWAPIDIDGCDGLRFLTVGDLPVGGAAPVTSLPHALPEGVSFPDLVAAADVVLSKPGYGIASECVLHRTPLVAIERPGFRETPILLRQLRERGPCAELSLEDFFAGRWEGPLRTALDSDAHWKDCARDGAQVVAERVLALIGGAR